MCLAKLHIGKVVWKWQNMLEYCCWTIFCVFTVTFCCFPQCQHSPKIKNNHNINHLGMGWGWKSPLNPEYNQLNLFSPSPFPWKIWFWCTTVAPFPMGLTRLLSLSPGWSHSFSAWFLGPTQSRFHASWVELKICRQQNAGHWLVREHRQS